MSHSPRVRIGTRLRRWLAIAGCGGALIAGPALSAAEPSPPPPAAATSPAPETPSSPAARRPLFDDKILCRGGEIEIRQSDLDAAWDQFRASAQARGDVVPESRRPDLTAMLLDRLVVTQLLMARATAEDKARARQRADRLVTEIRTQAGSEAAFKRQLAAVGFSPADLENQILERATCEEVVERELRPLVNVTDDQVRAFYRDNADRLRRPEMTRVRHLMLFTTDPATGAALDDAQKARKRQQIDQLLERVRRGEDFAALAVEFSEAPGAKEQKADYMFARGDSAPELEKAAAGLRTNQVSDVIVSQYGYHLIQLLQHIPAEQLELPRIEPEIREKLTNETIQAKLLPAFLDRVKTQAKLEYVNGAQPPVTPSAAPPAPAANPAPSR